MSVRWTKVRDQSVDGLGSVLLFLCASRAGWEGEVPGLPGAMPLTTGQPDRCTGCMTFNLRRWGAILLAGGLLLTAAYLIYPASAHDALIRPAAGLGLAGVLLALPGIVAFQWGQSARARVTGWLGTVGLVLGLAFLEIPHLVMGLFDPSRLYDLDSYHASTFGALEFYGIVLLAVGMVVLAVATWRSGFYPRFAFWLLVANLVVSALGSSVPTIAVALHQPAPSYLLMGLLGLAMRRVGVQSKTEVRSPMESATSQG